MEIGAAEVMERWERELALLPRRAQIRLMRRLAQAAVAGYDLPPVRLTLMVHRFNTTFRVDTADGERYVLRIHRAGTPTVETVGSELEWLAAITRDTTLEVPVPIAIRSGSLLTVAEVRGVVAPHICVLFRWLPGKQIRRGLTPGHMERVGELMARLENHGAQWQRPQGFVRGRVGYPVKSAQWEDDPLAPHVLADIHALVAESLSEAEAAEVTSILEGVRAVEEELGKGLEVFGLLHADLHYFNLLFGGGVVRAIDFDDCGFGYVLYDFAVMLNELLDRVDYAELRAGLLAGYRRVRALSAEREACIDSFIALRQVQDALWVLEERTHTTIGDDWATDVRTRLARLAAWQSRTLDSAGVASKVP
ncbi:MAG: phosphotransferase [Chloroflexota bacterium]